MPILRHFWWYSSSGFPPNWAANVPSCSKANPVLSIPVCWGCEFLPFSRQLCMIFLDRWVHLWLMPVPACNRVSGTLERTLEKSKGNLIKKKKLKCSVANVWFSSAQMQTNSTVMMNYFPSIVEGKCDTRQCQGLSLLSRLLRRLALQWNQAKEIVACLKRIEHCRNHLIGLLL